MQKLRRTRKNGNTLHNQHTWKPEVLFPEIPYPHKRKRRDPNGLLTDEIISEAQELVGLLGLRNEDLADYFDVNITTIESWCKKNDQFAKALKVGRIHYGLKVAKALCMKAVGFTMPDTHIMQHQGIPITVEYTKYYPPDAYAAHKYLSIIFRDIWADSATIKHEHSGTITHRQIEDLPLDELEKQERDLLFSLGLKQLNEPSKN
jgi:hypothetical protein